MFAPLAVSKGGQHSKSVHHGSLWAPQKSVSRDGGKSTVWFCVVNIENGTPNLTDFALAKPFSTTANSKGRMHRLSEEIGRPKHTHTPLPSSFSFLLFLVPPSPL
eukprot:g61571.t1